MEKTFESMFDLHMTKGSKEFGDSLLSIKKHLDEVPGFEDIHPAVQFAICLQTSRIACDTGMHVIGSNLQTPYSIYCKLHPGGHQALSGESATPEAHLEGE